MCSRCRVVWTKETFQVFSKCCGTECSVSARGPPTDAAVFHFDSPVYSVWTLVSSRSCVSRKGISGQSLCQKERTGADTRPLADGSKLPAIGSAPLRPTRPPGTTPISCVCQLDVKAATRRWFPPVPPGARSLTVHVFPCIFRTIFILPESSTLILISAAARIIIPWSRCHFGLIKRNPVIIVASSCVLFPLAWPFRFPSNYLLHESIFFPGENVTFLCLQFLPFFNLNHFIFKKKVRSDR